MPSDLTTALIALSGVGLTAIITYAVSERRLRVERRIEMAAGELLTELLSQRNFKTRKFSTIRGFMKGYTDEEIRRSLLAVGAICLTGVDGEELWGLLDRVKTQLRGKTQAQEVEFDERQHQQQQQRQD